MAADLSSLPELAEPVHPLIIGSDKSIALAIYSYEVGRATYLHGPSNLPKESRVMRLHAQRLDAADARPYFDVRYTQLQAELQPFLDEAAWSGATYLITAHGLLNRKSFTVEVSK